MKRIIRGNLLDLPSSLKVQISVERSKEVIDSVLNSMDLKPFDFAPVVRNWHIEEKDQVEPTALVIDYMCKSDTGHMLIHISSHMRSAEIEFLYDIALPDTEQWILETSRQLQEKFKAPKTPKFKVLVFQESYFSTEDINTNDFQSIDIRDVYNDDFIEIDEIISESIQKKESGMVLLHGEPGTGKTTYIKHLIGKNQDKEFIFIHNDFVKELLKPSFITFLIQNKNAILIIEDAEKVVISRENSADDSVVSTILQLTDGLFSDFLNIKIICTFNTNIDRIDKALMRKGRMIAKYKFAPLSPEKTAALAKKLGHENVTGSLTLADLFDYDKRGFSNTTKKSIGFAQT